MFSGIIEAFGKVTNIQKGVESCVLTFNSPLASNLKTGSSIAVNGVCLTVVYLGNSSFSVDVMPETVSKTNLAQLSTGDKVNLERPLSVDGRFEGHIVQGHVDGIGTIIEKKEVENAYEVRIKAPEALLKLCIEKGSITVDGISLTIVEANKQDILVSIIPYTSENTTLGFKKKGDIVNLEIDIIGKYIAKILSELEKGSKLRENLNSK